jgi:SHS2 domain-containing protein
MSVGNNAGFRELEHTADWELEVWAPDLPALLEQAAQGMNALAGVSLAKGRRVRREVKLPDTDPESVLVSFLSELLFLGEVEGLGFDRFAFVPEGDHLLARLEGAEIEAQGKHIKAVTYHELEVQQGPEGLKTRIVFDV